MHGASLRGMEGEMKGSKNWSDQFLLALPLIYSVFRSQRLSVNFVWWLNFVVSLSEYNCLSVPPKEFGTFLSRKLVCSGGLINFGCESRPIKTSSICSYLWLAVFSILFCESHASHLRLNQIWQQITSLKRWSDGVSNTQKNLKMIMTRFKTNL